MRISVLILATTTSQDGNCKMSTRTQPERATHTEGRQEAGLRAAQLLPVNILVKSIHMCRLLLVVGLVEILVLEYTKLCDVTVTIVNICIH